MGDDATTLGMGREVFLKKRASNTSWYHVVELPVHPMLDLTQVRSTPEPDLMEYLMAPPVVQSLAPETWEAVWQTISHEEQWLIATERAEGKTTLQCVICRDAGGSKDNATMNIAHLCFSKCQKAISEKVDQKSLLGAILECARESPPKVYAVEERNVQNVRSRLPYVAES